MYDKQREYLYPKYAGLLGDVTGEPKKYQQFAPLSALSNPIQQRSIYDKDIW